MPSLYTTSSTIAISTDGETWNPIAAIHDTIELKYSNNIAIDAIDKSFSLSKVKVKIKCSISMTRRQRILLFKLSGQPHGLRRTSRRAQKRNTMKKHRM